MAVTCTAQALATPAVCFTCLSNKQLRAVVLVLLCAQINGTTVTCNAESLYAAATAAGFMKISEKQQMAIEAYLLCQVANGGGGGGGGAQLVTYTAAQPAAPTDPTKPAIAYDPTGNLPTLGWNTSNNTWN